MIRVVVDDLASFAADALVRPATTRLDPTAAALRRLEIVGGQEFQTRIRLSRELAVGAAVVTAAGGDLPAEFVIHAVIRSETEPVTRGNVARAWLSPLHQAQEGGVAPTSAPRRSAPAPAISRSRIPPRSWRPSCTRIKGARSSPPTSRSWSSAPRISSCSRSRSSAPPHDTQILGPRDSRRLEPLTRLAGEARGLPSDRHSAGRRRACRSTRRDVLPAGRRQHIAPGGTS